MSFGQDGTVSVDGLRQRYERELGNDLGNLLSRTTAMIARYRGGELRKVATSPPWSAADLASDVAERLDAFDVTGALDSIWTFVRGLNRYVEATAPWQLAKDDAKAEELDTVLYDLVDGLTAVAVALAAYVPDTAPRILDALGQSDDLSWDRVRPGNAEAATGILAAPPLFPRIEPDDETRAGAAAVA